MKLYIVRHGIAVDVGQQGVMCDADRFLSDEGTAKTTDIAQALARVECTPELIASSPLIRADQTAAIMKKELAVEAPIETVDALTAGHATRGVVDWLVEQTIPSLMVVGHMPDLALLASVLLVGDRTVDIMFKKAAVCCLSFVDRIRIGEARMEWLMQPKQSRLIRKN